MMRLFRTVLSLTVLILLAGCYTFNPAGKSNIQSIAIERFDNKTTEYDLADRMTDLVIDAFLADGTMKIVSTENADAILVGVLTGYVREPYEYDVEGVVTSYSVTLTFDIVLKNPSDEDSEIWREVMSQEGIYAVDGQTEQDGQNTAVQLLITDIINRTTKSW